MSSPFSSMNNSINCVIKILLEGRAVKTTNKESLKILIFGSSVRIFSVFYMCFYGQYFSGN